MANGIGELAQLRRDLRAGRLKPRDLLQQVLERANSNAGRNVYLAIDPDQALRDAEELPRRFANEKPALYGLPISLKDCFDLAGFRTTCGTAFYAERNGVAAADSALAAHLKAQGAVIVGKTNLHPLAYGITGENPDYGDCTQPRDSQRLTGGSSSGAAAGVQEGSAVAAIGTDTGGSIRVPAALCGLAGYRASIGAAHDGSLWPGSMHLAQSFDTLGWIFRDLRDAPLLAEALFGIKVPGWNPHPLRIACVPEDFIHDCEPVVIDTLSQWQARLSDAGAEIVTFDSSFWQEAMEIFAPIQAAEAAAIHSAPAGGDFSHFERSIAERLRWGASIEPADLDRWLARHADFRRRMDELLGRYDFLIAPCAPVARLVTGADHSEVRKKILRYTVPLSLSGSPVVTLPGASGAGVQLAAGRDHDAELLAFAAWIGARIAAKN